MFGKLGDMAGLVKQAQEMQDNIAKMQEKMGDLRVSGSAGAGLVTVNMDGKGEIMGMTIDPSLMKPDEVEILQDLIMSAVNDAKQKAEAAASAEMEKATGGFSMPEGFKFPF